MAPSVSGPALPIPVPLPNPITTSSQLPQPTYRSKYCSQAPTNLPLSPSTVTKLGPQLRATATQQLIRNWQRYKSLDNSPALWGDEIEYQLIKFSNHDGGDDESENRQSSSRKAEPLLEQARVLKTLAAQGVGECFQAEYAKFQIESNPAGPYGPSLESLGCVERDMAGRRAMIKNALRPDETVLTLTAMPMFDLQGQSPEKIISQAAPAYSLSRKNQLARRGRNWDVHVPLYRDLQPASSADKPEDHLILEDLSYGVSQCCMQITMQARNMAAARHLYDQLIPLSPIMLALTAATPIYKNHLVDTDARWQVMTDLFDERSEREVEEGAPVRSRWCANTTYLNAHGEDEGSEKLCLPVDNHVLTTLLSAGMDRPLANHFAHIMHWNPIKLTTADISPTTTHSPSSTHLLDLFNNSYYQGVRFKPPPGGSNISSIGWRVEFRTMEVQPSDFENAAFAVFVFLVSRVVEEFALRLYVPLERVRENFERANGRGAVENGERFWFRVGRWCGSCGEDGYGRDRGVEEVEDRGSGSEDDEALYDLLTASEIINGPSSPFPSSPSPSFPFPGLIPLINLYLTRHANSLSQPTHAQIQKYLAFISKRATGQIPTPASWTREFVMKHEDYPRGGGGGGEGMVPTTTMFDLMRRVDELASAGAEMVRE